MGIRPQDDVFRIDEIREKSAALARGDAVLVDRKTHRDFGPRNGRTFSDADIGMTTEIGRKTVQVAGNFQLGTGLAADGAVLTSDEGFARLFPGRSADDVSVGLVRIAPGASAERVAADLRARLPADVVALSRDDVNRRETARWIHDTSIGVIFNSGVYVAMIVGIAIVYQVLSSDIADHMAEYATLKAIGYSNGYLAKIVIFQAIALAVLGFLPAVAISQGLYMITSAATNMPIYMTELRIAGVLGLSVLMCTLSGLGALRKLRAAEPADLF
jgi:putative ABC transport system permease protein